MTKVIVRIPEPKERYEVDNQRQIARALRAILEYDIKNGAGGFWLAGTTGEGPILSELQRRETAEIAADVCKGRVKTIMHVGGITTELSIAGAKACLLYTSPSPRD